MKRLMLCLAMSLAVITGCYGDDMFERPSVISVSPERDSTTVLPDTRIVIVFSRQMDTVKTNNEFSLSNGSGNIDGYYSWDSEGRSLTFTPKSNISMAEKYTIRVTEGAEDTRGNDLDGE
ncbi:MAG TPA: Ig-like domain-containing protein, partial [Spirochaetota bacterium]|nr:Ig-like domain-containing protein [Spirochaetota bacterium]HPJ41560.1 Ig-like domain-containing protein [Spirochaetota bacterium]